MRIETPAALEQSLPTENFVNSRNAATVAIGKIKDRRIGIG